MNGTLNKVMLIEHTGDDVKLHYFEGGNCVGRFPLATDESYTTKAGERVSLTEWHNVVVNNKAAEICEKYLKKGDKVYIEGKIRTRKWTDAAGVERYTTEILCREFTFLTPKGQSIQKPAEQTASPHSLTNSNPTSIPSETEYQGQNDANDEIDDVPF